MQWIVVGNSGAVIWAGPEPTATVNPAKAKLVPIPDQDTRFIQRRVPGEEYPVTPKPSELVLGEALYSDIPLRYTDEEIAAAWAAWTDKETDAAIGVALHPFAPIGEQIGELRNALVALFNELGIEPPASFARFNELAIAEIVKGQAKKAVL